MGERQGSQAGSSGVVNLYALLELDALEQDRTKIESALARVRALARPTANESPSGNDPALAKKAARLLALGTEHLLDPQRKQAFDKTWERKFGDRTNEQDWRWDLLNPALPQSDPCEAFDMAGYLEQAEQWEPHDPDEDFVRLSVLLGASLPADAVAVAAQPVPRAAPVIATAVPTSQDGDGRSAKLQAAPSPAGDAKPLAIRSVAPKSIAKKIRRKRDRSMLFAAMGILASLAFVLFLVITLIQGDSETIANADSGLNATQDNQPSQAAPTTATPRAGSGLPKVKGLDGLNLQTDVNVDSNANSMIAKTVGDETQAGSMDSAMDATMTDMTGENAMPSNAPPPISTMPAELSDEGKTRWRELMLELRLLASQQRFEELSGRLSEAEQIAVTEMQQDQLIRFKTMSQRAAEFHRALVEAVTTMSAGEAFKVGSSNMASFVEGGDSFVVLKISGSNQRYELSDMPLGIATGLAELKLDVQSPKALAQTAAFAFFHPSGNELALARARTLMAAAIGEGVLPEGILAIFDDDYQL